MTEYTRTRNTLKENERLRRELKNALDALKMARERLIEAQSELRAVKLMLIKLEEGR